MIKNRHIHINTKEDFEDNKPEIQDSSIVFCKESGEIVTHGENYGKPKWDEIADTRCMIEFIFNQTGEGEVITPIRDTGLLDYLADNIKIYQGKYQEDGSMLVTPLNIKVLKDGGVYYFEPVSYLDGSGVITDIQPSNSDNRDFFTYLPAIYYLSKEIEPDKFKITFSTNPFKGCHKVFGEDNLIGHCSGCLTNNNFYANNTAQGLKITLTRALAGIENRGKGYYGMTSDEMGVLMFLNIYYDRNVNRAVLYTSPFLGVYGLFMNGSFGRVCPPNIEINNAVAKVTHLDGNIEYLDVPYIWGGSIKKLYIGEYLTILPKEAGTGIYDSKQCYIGNSEGIAIYCSNIENHYGWQICGDRSDAQLAQEDGLKLKIRPCFKGRIVETQDVEYFKSLPIIN